MIKRILFGVAALAAVQASAIPAMAQTKLTYASYLSSRHNMHVGALEPFFRRVEADTKGSLKFELFADGTLAGGRNTLQAVRDGTVDMGLIVDLFTPGELKASAILGEMGLIPDDLLATAGAINEMQLLNCPQCDEDFQRNKVKPFVTYAATPFHLLCRTELTTLASLRGKKVRAVGPWASLMSAFGATPVNITGGELYEALERGQIDCTVASLAWLKTYSLVDVVKSVSTLPIGAYAGGSIVNMNTERWAQRTPEEKAAFARNAAKMVLDVAVQYEKEDQAAVEEAKARGIKFVEATDDLKAAFEKHKQGEMVRVAKLAERRGIQDGAALTTRYAELLDKWRGIVVAIKGDPDLYVKRLDEEIFSKLKL